MNTFTKTEVFLSFSVQKRSSVNGALVMIQSAASENSDTCSYTAQLTKQRVRGRFFSQFIGATRCS